MAQSALVNLLEPLRSELLSNLYESFYVDFGSCDVWESMTGKSVEFCMEAFEGLLAVMSQTLSFCPAKLWKLSSHESSVKKEVLVMEDFAGVLLLACNALSVPLCPSVGWSVGRLVGWSVGRSCLIASFACN